ncbi:MAG: hypothetical protein MMC23_007911 [Stictis urceolatum]|nr:hypothetical protein [Stictis urceolata]
MAQARDYDSDSASETESYTTTNVLLGYASKEPTDDSISQLGGSPTWIDLSKPPSAAYAKCKVCQNFMPLLLQLHTDLPERFPGHERRLHVFACKNKACRRKQGTIRVLRSTKVNPAAVKAENESSKAASIPASVRNLGNDIFGGSRSPGSASTNPFSTTTPASKSTSNPFSTTSSNPFSEPKSTDTDTNPDPSTPPLTFAQKASLHTPTSPPPPALPWPTSLPTYPHYHLDADYESLDALPTATIPSSTTLDSTPNTSSTATAEKEASDAFESSHDRAFQRFADRIGQNPEQVLRYEFGGGPLLYSDRDAVGAMLAPHQSSSSAASGGAFASLDAVAARSSKVGIAAWAGSTGMPGCTNCGAKRVFECQLMPYAIVELEAEDEGIDGMEWGTVIVGVCESDCEEAGRKTGKCGFVEEWAGVQWEEIKDVGAGVGAGGKGKGK